MLSPNDHGPFSPTDHNILVEDKRPSILQRLRALPTAFYPLTIQEILALSRRLSCRPESFPAEASVIGRIMIYL